MMLIEYRRETLSKWLWVEECRKVEIRVLVDYMGRCFISVINLDKFFFIKRCVSWEGFEGW